MPTASLTIRNIPARIMDQLRARAQANHRSLQGEVLATLEQATAQPLALSAKALHERVRALKLQSPAEAADMVRADRDAR